MEIATISLVDIDDSGPARVYYEVYQLMILGEIDF